MKNLKNHFIIVHAQMYFEHDSLIIMAVSLKVPITSNFLIFIYIKQSMYISKEKTIPVNLMVIRSFFSEILSHLRHCK